MVKDCFTHWGTAADVLRLHLATHDAGTGLRGRPLGEVQRGGAFVFDVFSAYEAGLMSSPNVAVAGAIGLGKSTVVKMMLDRGLSDDRGAVVLDPKGEYADLALAHGARVVALGRGDGHWCDPFDTTAQSGEQHTNAGDHGARENANKSLLRGLVATGQGAALTNEQHYVLDDVWREVDFTAGATVLRALYERLRPDLVSSANSARHSLALVLYRFVEGDWAGLFNGPGDPVDFSSTLVVLDLSAVWATSMMAVATVAAVAAAQRVLEQRSRGGYLVVDEAWSVLADEQALSWLHGSWKLARARGIAHVLVLHRFSDVEGTGDQGSSQRARALSLLRDCETAILFRQPPDEVAGLNEALSLSAIEARYVAQLPKGVALVRYGKHRSIVRFAPDENDARFIDTDVAMRST